MFSDALSPGGSGKKAPESNPEVHLGRRSLVPETRSGKKRKQVGLHCLGFRVEGRRGSR
jgi:hypothetical protein